MVPYSTWLVAGSSVVQVIVTEFTVISEQAITEMTGGVVSLGWLSSGEVLLVPQLVAPNRTASNRIVGTAHSHFIDHLPTAIIPPQTQLGGEFKRHIMPNLPPPKQTLEYL